MIVFRNKIFMMPRRSSSRMRCQYLIAPETALRFDVTIVRKEKLHVLLTCISFEAFYPDGMRDSASSRRRRRRSLPIDPLLLSNVIAVNLITHAGTVYEPYVSRSSVTARICRNGRNIGKRASCR